MLSSTWGVFETLVATAACTLNHTQGADDRRRGKPRQQGGEGKQGTVGCTQNTVRGGMGGGKRLKHLFRGWWMKGVCGSGVAKGGARRGGRPVRL